MQRPFVLPHQLFASLYRERPELFASAIEGSDAARDSLWKHLAPWVKGHPDLGSRSTSQCIPLGLHGDGGSYSRNDQLYVFTWDSLTGEGSAETLGTLRPSSKSLACCQTAALCRLCSMC